MEDDERPNPRQEQNKRETKKHKSHKRIPYVIASLGPVFQALVRGGLSWLYFAGPPTTQRHGTPKKNHEPATEKRRRP
jgi:hypothetical protein